MSTTSRVCTLVLVLHAAAAASAEDPANADHAEHQPSPELTPPQDHEGHEHTQPQASSEPTESERGHVAPDPPQHPMHEMSSERMIELRSTLPSFSSTRVSREKFSRSSTRSHIRLAECSMRFRYNKPCGSNWLE